MEIVLQVEADVIDGQIAALVLHLRRHDDGLFGLHGLTQDALEAAALIGRQAADAEALDDDGVVMLEQVRQHAAVRAGDHFHERDALTELVIEHGRGKGGRADIFHQEAVLQHGQLRIVDAGEGLQADGARFACTGAENDAAVEHDHHAAQIGHGAAERIGQIRLGIRVFKHDGLLRARQDDGLGGILDEIGQRRGCIGHGVRAVGDDEAVIFLIVGADGAGDRQPVRGSHIRRVDGKQLFAGHAAQR